MKTTEIVPNNQINDALLSVRVAKILLATLTLFIGGMIYLLLRPDYLLMFSWLEFFGVGKMVDLLRSESMVFHRALPNWVIYSLPQGLWAFSGVLYFDSVWKRPEAGHRVWILTFVVTALWAEVGQYMGYLPGHFGVYDFTVLTTSIGLAFCLFLFSRCVTTDQ
jgi:hypothetical protein